MPGSIKTSKTGQRLLFTFQPGGDCGANLGRYADAKCRQSAVSSPVHRTNDHINRSGRSRPSEQKNRAQHGTTIPKCVHI